MPLMIDGINITDLVQKHNILANQMGEMIVWTKKTHARLDSLEKKDEQSSIPEEEKKKLSYIDAAQLLFDSEFCTTAIEKKSLQGIINRIFTITKKGKL